MQRLPARDPLACGLSLEDLFAPDALPRATPPATLAPQVTPRPLFDPETVPSQLVICTKAYRRIMDQLAQKPPEDGGFLLGPKDSPHVITHFLPDREGIKTAVSYKPDATRYNGWLARLNGVFREVDVAGLAFQGVVHSHPSGLITPSAGDLVFAGATFSRAKNAAAESFFLPIVCNGLFHPYAVSRDLIVRSIPVLLI